MLSASIFPAELFLEMNQNLYLDLYKENKEIFFFLLTKKYFSFAYISWKYI